MKHRRWNLLAAGLLACGVLLAGCGAGQPSGEAADAPERDTLYQVALLQSLTLGDYYGSLTVDELTEQGDTGLGTFDGLNGEMIVLDGTVYQALADGSVAVAEGEETVPFADVTFFEADGTVTVSQVESLEELKEILDAVPAEQGANCFYMVKLTGTFPSVQVRSEYAQEEPYRRLDQVMETDQVIFDYRDVEGTVVGLWCPGYMDGLNTPGWHLHFLSADRTMGGHVLELSVEEGEAAYDRTAQFYMDLPEEGVFQTLDLSQDLSQAIEQVETRG